MTAWLNLAKPRISNIMSPAMLDLRRQKKEKGEHPSSEFPGAESAFVSRFLGGRHEAMWTMYQLAIFI